MTGRLPVLKKKKTLSLISQVKSPLRLQFHLPRIIFLRDFKFLNFPYMFSDKDFSTVSVVCGGNNEPSVP